MTMAGLPLVRAGHKSVINRSLVGGPNFRQPLSAPRTSTWDQLYQRRNCGSSRFAGTKSRLCLSSYRGSGRHAAITTTRGFAHPSRQSSNEGVDGKARPEARTRSFVSSARSSELCPFPSSTERDWPHLSRHVRLRRGLSRVNVRNHRFTLCAGSEYDYTWLEDKGWTPDLSFGQAARNSSCLVATSGRYIDYGHLWDAFEGLLYVPPPDDTPTATPRPITPTPVQPILVLLKFADPDGLVLPEDSYGFDEGETIRGITNEMQMYVSHLADLCGRELPRFYGLWTGQWNVYMMILESLGDYISDRDVDKAYDEGYDPEKDEDTWTDLPEGQRVQIAKLFNALHARGVVHRDVSLRNIRKRLVVSSPSSDPVSVPPLLSSSASSSTDAITTTTIDDSQTQTQTRTTDFPWVLTNMDRARKVTVNGPSVRKEQRKLGRLLGFPRYWHGWGLPEGAPAW